MSADAADRIKFRCTACQRKVAFGAHMAGQPVNCPVCGVVITVPAAPAAASPAVSDAVATPVSSAPPAQDTGQRHPQPPAKADTSPRASGRQQPRKPVADSPAPGPTVRVASPHDTSVDGPAPHFIEPAANANQTVVPFLASNGGLVLVASLGAANVILAIWLIIAVAGRL